MSLINGILIGSSTRKLCLAIKLLDDYTSSEVVNNLDVLIKDHNVKPIRNPSGYYLFFDLPDDNYTVQVKGGEYYFDEEKKTVRRDDLNELNPVIDIILKPVPSYNFPSTATLIRGHLKDSGGGGISGAVLRIKGLDAKTRTNDKGEFVIYLKGLKKNDVVTVDGKMVVKIKGKNPVFEIKHPDHKNLTRTVEVVEGITTSLSITYP
ncbi:MAG: hypothetical protein GQ533_14415 [Methanosarcinaceae archaeon]|nr:hypothetical protein [Methanosarcinaceae archaeon]